MNDETSLELDRNYGSPIAASDKQREPEYPSFHYEGEKELELPDEGEMTIHFRKTSSTSSVDKDGKHHYACTVEVQSFCDVDGADDNEDISPAHGSDKSVSDLLDGLMEKHMESKKEKY